MHPDFIIIGGGIIGLASALELARAGLSVAILEQEEAGRGASWAGGGILALLPPWEYGEDVHQLARLSSTLYPAFIEGLVAETGIDPEFLKSGLLMLPPYDPARADSWRAANGGFIRAARDIAPALNCNENALWMPEVWQVRNPRLIRAVRACLESRGVQIFDHTPATELRIEGKRVLSVAAGSRRFSAHAIVIAAGAWSAKFLGARARGLAIHPVRGQMLLYKNEPGLLQAVVLRAETYLVPRKDGHILAGSTMEETGFDCGITETAARDLGQNARALLPQLGTPIRHWAGLRPGSPGNVPTIARHPEIENLYVNSGHFRYGVTLAPASARLLYNLAAGRPQPIDVGAYRWPA